MATFDIENGVLKRIFAEDDEKEIVIPEGVTSLGYSWFSRPRIGIKRSIRLPSTLKSIEPQYNWFPFIDVLDFGIADVPLKYPLHSQYSFQNKVLVDSNNPRFKVIDGVFIDSRNKILYLNTEPIFKIPDDTLKIEEYAFGSSDLEAIETNECLKIIEKGAFYFCSNLKKLIIKGELEKLSGDLLGPHSNAEIIIHISSKLKKVSKKPFNFDLVKEIYFDSKTDDFLKNPFIDLYLANATKCDSKIYFLDDNNNYVLEGTMEKYAPKKEKPVEKTELYKTDENGNKYYIKDGTLYKFEGTTEKLVIPSEVKVLGSRLFLDITSIDSLYITPNIIEISNGMFVRAASIKNLYFDGDYASFSKINFSSYGGRRPLIESIKHIYVKDENSKYYEIVNGNTKMVESKGISIAFLHDLLSRNNDLIKNSSKEMMKKNEDSFLVYFRYYKNRPTLIMETKLDSLSKDIKSLLIDEKVSFISDDLIVNFGIDKNTKINKMCSNHKMTPIKPTYGENIINSDEFIGFNLDLTHFKEWEKASPVSVKVDISKGIKKIAPSAFKNVGALFILYEGTVKEWLAIDIKDDLRKHTALVLASDGVILYENVDHKKTTSKNLYYAYAWLNNQYLYSLQFFIRKNDIWGFLDSFEKAIISSYYFVASSVYAFDFDGENDEQYSILDFHNFKCIGVCDVEAG